MACYRVWGEACSCLWQCSWELSYIISSFVNRYVFPNLVAFLRRLTETCLGLLSTLISSQVFVDTSESHNTRKHTYLHMSHRWLPLTRPVCLPCSPLEHQMVPMSKNVKDQGEAVRSPAGLLTKRAAYCLHACILINGYEMYSAMLNEAKSTPFAGAKSR